MVLSTDPILSKFLSSVQSVKMPGKMPSYNYPKRKRQQEEATSTKENIEPELIKHPLQNSWTLWYFQNDKNRDWKDNLRQVVNFDTVEDFWSVFHHVKSASELKHSNDYYVFKTGIIPMWEDSANKNGGKWVLNIDKKRDEIDMLWLEVLLCLIGESFEDFTDEVCGAVVNIRPKMDKICIWTAHTDRAPVMTIGRVLKERLNLANKQQLFFTVHSEAMAKGGTVMAKNQYIL